MRYDQKLLEELEQWLNEWDAPPAKFNNKLVELYRGYELNIKAGAATGNQGITAFGRNKSGNEDLEKMIIVTGNSKSDATNKLKQAINDEYTKFEQTKTSNKETTLQQQLKTATRIKNNASVDLNALFTTNIMQRYSGIEWGNIIPSNNGATLVLSAVQNPQEIEGKLKPIVDRRALKQRASNRVMYSFNISGREAFNAGLMQHGRYIIGTPQLINPEESTYECKLELESVCESPKDRKELTDPALTVATASDKKDKLQSRLAETATAGATSSASIGTVDSPHISPGRARGKKSYIGSPGKSGTKAPPQPKPKKQKPTDNALTMKGVSLFGGKAIKRAK